MQNFRHIINLNVYIRIFPRVTHLRDINKDPGCWKIKVIKALRLSASVKLISRDEVCVRVNVTGSTNPVTAQTIPGILSPLRETGRPGTGRGQTMRT